MEQELRRNLLCLIAAYADCEGGLAESTIERRAIGYCGFFEKIREDCSFSVRKYDQVVQWLDENWPAGAVWPKDVVRPCLSGTAVTVPDESVPGCKGQSIGNAEAAQ